LVCAPLGLSVTDFWTVLGLLLVIHYSYYRDWSSSVIFYKRCEIFFFTLEFAAVTWTPTLFKQGLLFVHVFSQNRCDRFALMLSYFAKSIFRVMQHHFCLIWMFNYWIIDHLWYSHFSFKSFKTYTFFISVNCHYFLERCSTSYHFCHNSDIFFLFWNLVTKEHNSASIQCKILLQKKLNSDDS
jgi:hypothetical protein